MSVIRFVVSLLVSAAVSIACVVPATASEWFVSAGGTGSGTSAGPFGRVQQALDVAQPGDTVTIGPGTYVESLQTGRAGTATRPIRVRAQGQRGTTTITFAGRVLNVNQTNIQM